MTLTKDATIVELPGALFGLEYGIEHYQHTGESEGGDAKVYDHQVNRYIIKASVRISDSQRADLRSFIRDTIVFAKETFTLTPDSGIDLGAGAGNDVTVRYWPSSYKEKAYAPGRYEVSLTFRREAS